MSIKILNRSIFIFLAFYLILAGSDAQIIYAKVNRPDAPVINDLPLADSISQYGITWRFNKKVRVGKFVDHMWAKYRNNLTSLVK